MTEDVLPKDELEAEALRVLLSMNACNWHEPPAGLVESLQDIIIALNDDRLSIRAAQPKTAMLLDAVKFYADPSNYWAITILPDPPCGSFADDLSEVDFPPGCVTERPGKLARDTLEAVFRADPVNTHDSTES